MQLTRRDAETLLRRFWLYESTSITLLPVDESQPRLGGKVQAKSMVLDFRTLTLSSKTQYGVYSDDFVVFATFDKDSGNPLEDEELLLKVMESEVSDDRSALLDKTTFRFEGNRVVYGKEVNAEREDTELNHAIEETKLDVLIDESWTESLFYGIGNKAV